MAEPASVPAPPADAQLPAIEVLIDEEEFDSAIPEVSPDDDEALLQPLESIEEFERRLAGEQEPDALAQATPADPLGDPELRAPLPPIDDLLSEPFEFAEQSAPSPEQAELAYRYTLAGLDNADRETSAELRGQFRELSALRAGDGEVANIAQLRARQVEDAELLRRILAAEGWYEARIDTQVEQQGDGEEAQSYFVTLTVEPGPRYVFSDIAIEAGPVEPEGLLRDNLPLQVGAPIIATQVQAAEANLSVILPRRGYPFAELGQRDILLDRATGDGAYTLPVDTGPRSVFDSIVTTGDLAFDAEHIAQLARFERGELYDAREVEDLRQALVATGLFSSVSVEPQRSGELTEDGSEYATLLVRQYAGPARRIAGSAGYGTGEGIRLEGSWTHRNLFPPEGALIARAVAGTKEQGAGLTFRRSNAGKRDRTFELSAEAMHSDYDAFEAYTGRLAGLVSYSSTPLWQKPVTYSYGGQLLVSNEQDFNLDTLSRERRTFYIAGLSGKIGLDTSDSLLDPTQGFRLSAMVEPEGSLQGDFSPYVRAQLDGSAYFSATDSLVLAGRVRLGTIQGIDRFDLAPSRRFYAGGGGSVRGFGYQELGPSVFEPNPSYPDVVDPATDPADLPAEFLFRPIGGLSLFEASAEMRYRFGDFGVAAFLDAGQVYTDSMPHFSDIRFGAGVGARYYTNFGPLRFDIAMPLDKRAGDNDFAVYVSIGQAF